MCIYNLSMALWYMGKGYVIWDWKELKLVYAHWENHGIPETILVPEMMFASGFCFVFQSLYMYLVELHLRSVFNT